MKEFINYKFFGLVIICLLYLFKLNHLIGTSLAILYCLLVLYVNNRKSISFKESLLDLVILSLPFSFIPLLEQLNFVSLFVVLQVIIIVAYFKISKRNFFAALILLLFLLINVVYLFNLGYSGYFSFEIMIKINLFVLFSYVISVSFKLSDEALMRLKKSYIISGLVSAITIILQYVFNVYLGITDLGTQSKFGEVRQGFTGLFFDYSIMSVYMASLAGFILLTILLKKLIVKSLLLNLLLVVFFLGVSALTSARSGIFAFFATVVFFLIWNRRFVQLFFLGIISIPFIFLILYIIALNRSSDLSADSGRFYNFQKALDYFYDNPFFGSGGIGYNAITNNMLPHNFILDLLADFGILITCLILLKLFYVFKVGLKDNMELSFVLVLFMIGGLFHASFINTHYIIFPIALILGYNNFKNESTSSY